MLRRICGVSVGMVLLASIAVAQEAEVMGNWEGNFTKKDWAGKPISAQIVAQGRDAFRGVIEFDVAEGQTTSVRIKGEMEKKGAAFSGKADLGPALGGECEVSGEVVDGLFSGKFRGRKGPGAFEMKRVLKGSPTLGAKPPEGAVVLFDGTNLDAWKCSKTPWEIVEGGAMEIRPGNIVSKQEFADCTLHVEFRTPFMPPARGQARGNSGVYVQGRYEVQVLDSFGLAPADNGCGGIYKKAVPKVKACLPPLEWQTYDIVFRAPRLNDAGETTENARITVKHNGILIHDDVELDGVCGGGVGNQTSKTGPLMLQDHHNRVQYRNIWILPM